MEVNLDKHTYMIIGNQYADSNVTKVTLNDELNTIADYGLAGNNLTEITLPNSLRVLGKYSLSENKIEDALIPGTLPKVGFGAFHKNKIRKLIIEEGVKEIFPLAFALNNIEHIHLPKSIEKVGLSAFANNNVKTVIIDNPNIDLSTVAFAGNNIKSFKVLMEDQYIELNEKDIKRLPNVSGLLNLAKYKNVMKNAIPEFNNIPIEAVYVLDASNVTANLLRLNIKKYHRFKERLINYFNKDNLNIKELKAIFSISYMLDFLEKKTLRKHLK